MTWTIKWEGYHKFNEVNIVDETDARNMFDVAKKNLKLPWETVSLFAPGDKLAKTIWRTRNPNTAVEIEGTVILEFYDDGRKVMVTEVDDGSNVAAGLFVRLQSWSEKGDHRELEELVGKKVRITIDISS